MALLAAAGLPPGSVRGIADGAPAKQGRRMPGTDIPVVAPEALARQRTRTSILLMLPDLAGELRDAWPSLADRWGILAPAEPVRRWDRCRTSEDLEPGQGDDELGAPLARVLELGRDLLAEVPGRTRM